jgi:hypothetical protein
MVQHNKSSQKNVWSNINIVKDIIKVECLGANWKEYDPVELSLSQRIFEKELRVPQNARRHLEFLDKMSITGIRCRRLEKQARIAIIAAKMYHWERRLKVHPDIRIFRRDKPWNDLDRTWENDKYQKQGHPLDSLSYREKTTRTSTRPTSSADRDI